MRFVLLTVLALSLGTPNARAAKPRWLTVKASPGDGIILLLTRYDLYPYTCNEKKFYQLNGLKPGASLHAGRPYKLPILVYHYNGKSIRSTIGDNNLEKAIRIKTFNEILFQKGLRSASFLKDKELWVPYHELKCPHAKPRPAPAGGTFPIFGKKYAEVKPVSAQLKGKVFYIVSGHGGRDSGALGKRAGHTLCEDEYGYDVALRLARKLIARGATAHVILRDPNDGIRDQAFLPCDTDEVYLGNKNIHPAQIPRLQQRAEIINQLYLTYKNRGVPDKNQIAVMLHVDSRNARSRADVFFYYAPGATYSQTIAQHLHKTFDQKYKKHQANRGYKGTVSPRDLYMLVNLKPPAVYLELANIRNAADQRRLVIWQNRDALAKWIADGFVSFFQ